MIYVLQYILHHWLWHINYSHSKSPALENFYVSETIKVLKESVVHVISIFQHASELIL